LSHIHTEIFERAASLLISTPTKPVLPASARDDAEVEANNSSRGTNIKELTTVWEARQCRPCGACIQDHGAVAISQEVSAQALSFACTSCDACPVLVQGRWSHKKKLTHVNRGGERGAASEAVGAPTQTVFASLSGNRDIAKVQMRVIQAVVWPRLQLPTEWQSHNRRIHATSLQNQYPITLRIVLASKSSNVARLATDTCSVLR
jgi:hypothetical protein